MNRLTVFAIAVLVALVGIFTATWGVWIIVDEVPELSKGPSFWPCVHVAIGIWLVFIGVMPRVKGE